MLNMNLAHESDDALMVRTAWLYHIAGLTQEETATRLGLHRSRVNRLLSEARDRGIVSISIAHDAARNLENEDAMASAYGLDFCLSTPVVGFSGNGTDGSEREVQGKIARRAVGNAAANFLKGKLLAGPLTVGVGWGRTIEQLALQLSGVRNSEATFVSIMGSLTRNSAANPFDVVQALAARTGGEAHFLPVPFIADTEADRAVLMSQRVVAETMNLAGVADIYLISLGEMGDQAFLNADAMLSREEVLSLRARGVVCDTLGQFFDDAGKVVQHEVSQRTLAIDLDMLRGRNVVLLSAGIEKVRATRALLRSGLVRGVIIDGDSAAALSQFGSQ